MKIFVPPLVTILLTILVDKLIDLILGLETYDDSGTPGIVFMIEAIMITSFIIFGVLLHGILIVRIINKSGQEGFKKIITWGLLVILMICTFYIIVITNDLNYSLSLQIQNGFRLFFILTFMLMTNLLTLKVIKKYVA
jgi:hypothetical protein